MPYSFPVKAIVLFRSIQVSEAGCQRQSAEYFVERLRLIFFAQTKLGGFDPLGGAADEDYKVLDDGVVVLFLLG